MTLSAEKIFFQCIKMSKKLKPRTHMQYVRMSFQGDFARLELVRVINVIDCIKHA